MNTVLVVDDMAIFRDPIAACLKVAGYRAICASNGQEALDMVRAEAPGLVLLDVAMPVMNGLTVLSTLRANPRTAALPVILLTAMSDKASVLAAAKLGVRDYMLKSAFSLRELLERVARHLSPSAAVSTPGTSAPAAPAQEVPPAGGELPRGTGFQPVGDSKPANNGQAVNNTEPASSDRSVSDSMEGYPTLPGPRTEQPGMGDDATIPQLMTRSECIRRTQKALGAKTLSGVVMQVVGLAASPRGDMSDLATLIGRDPLLSARVLQVANSAAYASSRMVVNTIADAVRKIGCSTIRNIAAALGVFDAMPMSGADGFNPIRCWQHSFGVAMLCEQLVGAKTPDLAGGAYLAGLCHDLGDILFHTHFGPEHQQVLAQQEQTGRPRSEVERLMLGITQGELVLNILQSMGLPEAIQRPIELFHKAAEGLTPESRNPVARALRLADLYANGILLASSGQSVVAPISRLDFREITGRDDFPPPDASALRSQILGLTGMLARLSAEEEAQLMAPLFASTEARIYLARDPALSSFDPVAAAMESLAQVEVQPQLPSSQPPAASGMVILARSGDAAGFDRASITKAAGALPAERVLWLVDRREDRRAATPLSPVTCPISLSRLAELVSRAAEARVVSRALSA